jgi:erythromycin esterase
LRYAVELDLQLRAVAALMAGDAAACQANIRDLAMADTVGWLLTRHRRVVIAAHNGHIQRTPISTVEPHPPVDTLGVHLAERLGEQYLTIGTTCGGGEIIVPRTSEVDGQHQTELTIADLPPAEKGSLDCLLDNRISSVGLLDLRTLDARGAAAIDAAGRMLVQNQYVKVDAGRSFDMLIHVPRISLWNSSTNASLPDDRGG